MLAQARLPAALGGACSLPWKLDRGRQKAEVGQWDVQPLWQEEEHTNPDPVTLLFGAGHTRPCFSKSPCGWLQSCLVPIKGAERRMGDP